jgi:hypothetical protein
VRIVCPCTRRYVYHGSHIVPGLAAEAYAATKWAKYADQDNFVPFIVETGGRVNKQARQFLDSLMPPPDPDPAPGGR